MQEPRFVVRDSGYKKNTARKLSEKQQRSLRYCAEQAQKYSWIETAVLFGSCARKTQKYTSDVDVLFVTKDDAPGDIMRHIKAEMAALDDEKYAEIDCKFMEREYFFYGHTTFLDEVRKEGRIVWTRDRTTTLRKTTTSF